MLAMNMVIMGCVQVQVQTYFRHTTWHANYPHALEVSLPPCEHNITCDAKQGCVRDGVVSSQLMQVYERMAISKHKTKSLVK